MVYLDYAATTPVAQEVLDEFCSLLREYPANPNSPYPEGERARERLTTSTRQLAQLLHVEEDEIIYTSGASESNNLAIKGAAEHYRARGRHIVTTPLEHSSVSGPLLYLQQQGYEVDTVRLTPEGAVDLEHLASLVRADTVLVSVCMADSELGLVQELGAVKQLLAGYPDCILHTDATQAAGKLVLSALQADLITFSPHKFYGITGVGVLVRKRRVLLEPQIHGGLSTTPFRSGTPALGLAVSAYTALSLCERERKARFEAVKKLNDRLHRGLGLCPGVLLNSTARSLPHILNFSIPGENTEALRQKLGERGFSVASRAACCAPGSVSRPVYALTHDRKRALSSLRISLSHLTREEDVDAFLNALADCRAEQ